MNPLNSIKFTAPPFVRGVGFAVCAAVFSALFGVSAFAYDAKAAAKRAYYDFLTGKQSVYLCAEELFVDNIDNWLPSAADYDRYALLDFNGDGVDECYAFVGGGLMILTYENGAIMVRYASKSLEYYEPLNDGSFFLVNYRGYRVYEYFVWREGRYVKDCWFCMPTRAFPDLHSSRTPEEDPYEINAQPVTDEEFEAFTRPIFAIGSNKIKWFEVRDYYALTFHGAFAKPAPTKDCEITFRLSPYPSRKCR